MAGQNNAKVDPKGSDPKGGSTSLHPFPRRARFEGGGHTSCRILQDTATQRRRAIRASIFCYKASTIACTCVRGLLSLSSSNDALLTTYHLPSASHCLIVCNHSAYTCASAQLGSHAIR